MNIVLPIAGKSSRFPNMRPKWMLTHPNGNFMLVESIKKIAQEHDRVYIIYLKEHEEKYSFKKGLIENIQNVIGLTPTLIELENTTKDQVETVYLGLKELPKGLFWSNMPFLIKDCDNVFSFDRKFNHEKNHVMYASLKETKNSDPSSKSYIRLNEFGLITNIVEKEIISDEFCCGGYFFRSSKEFLNTCDDWIKDKEWYISDVIFKMSLEGVDFSAIKCNEYIDWGTLKDWKNYKDKFKTIFVDLDGVVFYNSSAYLKPYIGDTKEIEDNIKILKELVDTGFVELIITTSRPERYRRTTEKQLKKAGIKYKQMIMGLQHNKRIIINDFNSTNPYPTCQSINLKRDQGSLGDFFK